MTTAKAFAKALLITLNEEDIKKAISDYVFNESNAVIGNEYQLETDRLPKSICLYAWNMKIKD
jgi:hypothetical protein